MDCCSVIVAQWKRIFSPCYAYLSWEVSMLSVVSRSHTITCGESLATRDYPCWMMPGCPHTAVFCSMLLLLLYIHWVLVWNVRSISKLVDVVGGTWNTAGRSRVNTFLKQVEHHRLLLCHAQWTRELLHCSITEDILYTCSVPHVGTWNWDYHAYIGWSHWNTCSVGKP